MNLGHWTKTESFTSGMDTAIKFGLNCLKYDTIRPHQKTAVEGYLSGKDVFMCTPTGSGKSLVFEIAPFALHVLNGANSDIPDPAKISCKKILVISPLVALMRMHTKGLLSRNVRAVYVNDDFTTDDSHNQNCSSLEAAQIIFASPESVLNEYRDVLMQMSDKVAGIFIDEAHCILK